MKRTLSSLIFIIFLLLPNNVFALDREHHIRLDLGYTVIGSYTRYNIDSIGTDLKESIGSALAYEIKAEYLWGLFRNKNQIGIGIGYQVNNAGSTKSRISPELPLYALETFDSIPIYVTYRASVHTSRNTALFIYGNLGYSLNTLHDPAQYIGPGTKNINNAISMGPYFALGAGFRVKSFDISAGYSMNFSKSLINNTTDHIRYKNRRNYSRIGINLGYLIHRNKS